MTTIVTHAARAFAVAMLLLWPGLALAATLPATPANLAAVVAGAQPGDTVKVTGVVPAPRLTPKPGLTFDMTDAVAVEWRLGYWKQVRFVGGVYRATLPNRSGIEISGEDIAFINPRAEGPGVVDGAVGEGYGISLLGTIAAPVKNARITGGYFDGLMAGVRVNIAQGLVVETSKFTRIRADGISIAGVDGFELSHNTFWDFRTSEKHADAIQANRPLLGVPVTKNGLIKGNRAEGTFQAYFVPDTEDVTLDGNWSKVTMATGIGVSGSKRATLKDNTIETLHPSDTISRVDDRGAVDLRYVGSNVAAAYAGRPAIVYSQGLTPLEAATARADKAEAALKASEAARAALALQLKAANDNAASANARIAAAQAALAR